MKKLQGFTLIELMVVMAIIAILATAGLSAYTGYIKKARDTKRISDLSAINTIVLANMANTGLSPSVATLKTDITAANNGKAIIDPLQTASGSAGTSNCLATGVAAATADAACAYYYQQCDSATGYRVMARFESPSNAGLYTVNSLTTGTSATGATATLYQVGTCSGTAANTTPADLTGIL